MNELDVVWSQKVNDALAKAEKDGRGDVADYLKLRTTNDNLRQASVKWLFDALVEIAAFANDHGDSVIVEPHNQHQFKVGNATLSGASVNFRLGVRCLTVEAGWTRAPADGFMRGGALAVGRVSHFGLPKHNAELFLLVQNETLGWFSSAANGSREIFDSKNLNEHFRIFLGREI